MTANRFNSEVAALYLCLVSNVALNNYQVKYQIKLVSDEDFTSASDALTLLANVMPDVETS